MREIKRNKEKEGTNGLREKKSERKRLEKACDITLRE